MYVRVTVRLCRFLHAVQVRAPDPSRAVTSYTQPTSACAALCRKGHCALKCESHRAAAPCAGTQQDSSNHHFVDSWTAYFHVARWRKNIQKSNCRFARVVELIGHQCLVPLSRVLYDVRVRVRPQRVFENAAFRLGLWKLYKKLSLLGDVLRLLQDEFFSGSKYVKQIILMDLTPVRLTMALTGSFVTNKRSISFLWHMSAQSEFCDKWEFILRFVRNKCSISFLWHVRAHSEFCDEWAFNLNLATHECSWILCKAHEFCCGIQTGLFSLLCKSSKSHHPKRLRRICKRFRYFCAAEAVRCLRAGGRCQSNLCVLYAVLNVLWKASKVRVGVGRWLTSSQY